MNRLLLVVLVVLLLGSAGFGVAQLSEIRKLQQNMADLGKERTALQKSVWDLTKRNNELGNRRGRGNNTPATPATEGEPAGETAAFTVATPGGPRGGGGPNRNNDGPGRINNILNNPEMQQLMAVQQKAALDGRYAALFRSLKLSPADLEKFKTLLVEKQSAVMDVMAAAQAEGLNGRENRDSIRQLVTDTQAELDNSIRATIGETGFAQYQNFDTTQPQRSVVGQLEQRLSYSGTPLTDTQSEQLVQILAQNAPPNSNPARNPGGAAASGFIQTFVGRGGAINLLTGGSVPITDAAIAQSSSVLSAQQVSALQSLQQEQQASLQLMQQLRGNADGRNRRGNAAAGTAAPTGPATTPAKPAGPGGG